MRRAGHAVLTTDQYDLGIAGPDRLGGHMQDALATAADLVDCRGRNGIGDAGVAGGLASGVLAGPGLQNLTDQYIIYLRRIEAGFGENGRYRRGAEAGSRQSRETAAKLCDCCSFSCNNNGA
ncbi:hypothetical protein GCM10007989_21180 [Devosia pacifica]|uniref:Uncharacterized protein n=1 Tax=Devosia pacifica TaxID=1335967 RepID=A0A918VTZ4_9HYPH|nr:hypothetical protein GCM10007989_21180 [Devosia pacifica]